MPYRIGDKEYHRVTEVTGASECLATAKGVKEGDVKLATTTPLAGTLVHRRIQNLLLQKCGLKPEPLEFAPPTNLIWRKIKSLHDKQKKKDSNAITSYETLLKRADKCWQNFLSFMDDVEGFEPVCDLIEAKVYSNKIGYAGTADIIFILPMKGKRVKRSHDISGANKEFPEYDYFIECDRDHPYKKEKDKRCPKYEGTGKNKVNLPECSCKWEMVVTLGDWKTSSQKQKGHKKQLSAYHYACEEMGIWDRFRKAGEGKGGAGYAVNWECWSVLLGDHNLKTIEEPYRLFRYEPYINDFLESSRSFHDPREITVNEKGDIGLKGRCMFCNHVLDCPDRVIWSQSQKQEIFINPLTHSEINKGLVILEKLETKGVLVSDLVNKFRAMKRIYDIHMEWSGFDEEIIGDLTDFLEIPHDHVTREVDMEIDEDE